MSIIVCCVSVDLYTCVFALYYPLRGLFFFFFFFKQKTAYEMRISDWSSDVCSSDLRCRPVVDSGIAAPHGQAATAGSFGNADGAPFHTAVAAEQIGRASCRERVCQYV